MALAGDAKVIDAFRPVRDLEAALCDYTGAPYAVAVNSCSMALLLAVALHVQIPGLIRTLGPFQVPKRTYVSVPMSIRLAGGEVEFIDDTWEGLYPLRPYSIFDSARWFTSGMFNHPCVRSYPQRYVCVSFHHSKVLGDTQGGVILHNHAQADTWFRRARFDGRTEGVDPKDDTFDMLGWHCYMSPDVATRLLWRMSKLPAHNEPLPNDDYPDLSLAPIFK